MRSIVIVLTAVLALTLLESPAMADDVWTTGESFTYKLTGNVGIGRENPGTKLFVEENAANWTGYFLNSNSAANGLCVNLPNASSGNEIALGVYSAAETRLAVLGDGKVGIGTREPSAQLDVNSDIVRVRTAKTPASASDTGNAGDICWDASYVYVCVATNSWKRVAIAAW